MWQNGGIVLKVVMAAGVWMRRDGPPRTRPRRDGAARRRRTASRFPAAVTDLSAQRRAHRRSPTRIRVHPRHQPDDVYPRYNPGPNAVRDCNATYVREFRPSGTVIVPRMTCVWRHG